MPQLRPNWYNLNSGRRYPLDDKATGTDDVGARLSDDVIVDCHLRFPHTAGRHAFVGGLTVTDSLVTVVFLGSLTISNTRDRFVPLGSITVVKPVKPHVLYPIQPLYPGVGGFVAFGDVSEPSAIRFSTPIQGLLAPRCARGYDPLPVSEMRKLGLGTGLTGLITIVGEDDIEVVKDTVIITDPADLDAYQTVDALVLRLRQATGGVNVLEKYIGPCGARPESGNCARLGIELINDARPDCDGNINFDFRNMVVGSLSGCEGFMLDTSIGMATACRDFVPDRFQGQDLCLPRSSSSSSPSSASSQPSVSGAPPVSAPSSSSPSSSLSLPSGSLSLPSVGSSPSSSSSSLSLGPCFERGFCTAFDYASDAYLFWDTIAAGNDQSKADDYPAAIFDMQELDADPSESCRYEDHPYVTGPQHVMRMGALGQRAIWLARVCEGNWAPGTQTNIIADMQFTNGSNAGIVVGWEVVGLETWHVTYFMILANLLTDKLEVWWYPAKEPPVKIGERSYEPFVINENLWYRWRVYIFILSPTTALINASLSGVNDHAFPRVSYSFAGAYNRNGQHGFAVESGASIASWISIGPPSSVVENP